MGLEYQSREWLHEKYVVEGLTTKHIAELVGCSSATIRKWLTRHDIPKRPHSESIRRAWEQGTYKDRKENPRWLQSVAGGTKTPWEERKPIPNVEAGTALIPLTRGQFAIVDLQDANWLAQYKWSLSGSGNYAEARVDGRQVYMHRLLLNFPEEVDHRNGNGLDNRRSNIRPCTTSQNRMNTGLRSDNSSGYKGVSWCKIMQRWKAMIQRGGQSQVIGYFDDKIDAARAYDAEAIIQHGEFAHTNFSGGV